MTSHLEQAEEFRWAMGQPIGNATVEQIKLQWDLIEEEMDELAQECYGTVADLKELADLVYVCYQYAAAQGYELDTALDRVHESNMSKLVDGKPIKNEAGKVLKGPNYKPPFLDDLI